MRDTAAEGVRCVFEMNEYISIRLDTETDKQVNVWVIAHGANDDDYANAELSTDSEGFAALWTLERVDDPGLPGEIHTPYQVI